MRRCLLRCALQTASYVHVYVQVFVFAYTSLNYTADDIYKLYYGRRK